MTDASLSIALDLDGSGFSRGEQALLNERLARELARINAEGGLFGRTLAPAAAPDAFIAISWAGLADSPSLAIVARPPGGTECAMCCASLHAGLDTQVEWLGQWLEARKTAAMYRGSLADTLAPPGGAAGAAATVHLGKSGELTSPRQGPLYLFADLGMPVAPLSERPATYLVSAVDLDARMAAVDALIRAEPPFAATPRLASAAVELDIALRHLLAALTDGGRRVMRYDVCRHLREAVPKDYAFSILDVARGSTIAHSTD